MTVNNKVSASDYNNIRSKVVSVLGSGSVDYGYGQVVQSSVVDEGRTVGINDWGLLAYDIINSYVHQNGTTPTLPSVATHAIIRSDADATSCTASISGTTMYVTSMSSGMLAVGQTITGTGVSGSTVITAKTANPLITVTSFGSTTSSVISMPLSAEPTPRDTAVYLVVLNVTAQTVALPTGVYYTVSGNSNSSFNGTWLSYAATTNTVTLIFPSNPGTYGTGTTRITVTESDPWGYGTWTINNSHTLSSRAIAANNSTTYPITYYDTIATTLQSNRFTVAQYITANKGSTSQTWPGSLGTTWKVKVSCTVTATFGSAAQARYFFNSGGTFTFQSSLTSPTLSNNQILGWQNLLSGLGTAATWGTSGFYSLTSTYVQVYSKAASGAYTGNYIKISARTPDVTNNSAGTALKIEFLVEWIDGYTDPPAPYDNPANFPPGDDVDGTLSILSLIHI